MKLKIETDVPDELLGHMKDLGRLEPCYTIEESDVEHARDFSISLKLTREHFGYTGPVSCHFVSTAGNTAQACNCGVSPTSPLRARIFTGLWNAVLDTIGH